MEKAISPLLPELGIIMGHLFFGDIGQFQNKPCVK